MSWVFAFTELKGCRFLLACSLPLFCEPNLPIPCQRTAWPPKACLLPAQEPAIQKQGFHHFHVSQNPQVYANIT